MQVLDTLHIKSHKSVCSCAQCNSLFGVFLFHLYLHFLKDCYSQLIETAENPLSSQRNRVKKLSKDILVTYIV